MLSSPAGQQRLDEGGCNKRLLDAIALCDGGTLAIFAKATELVVDELLGRTRILLRQHHVLTEKDGPLGGE